MANVLIANDIMNMAPGPELDALVAEKVMGKCAHRRTESYHIQSDSGHTCLDCRKDMYHNWTKEYSKDMTAAWEVVEKLKESSYWLSLVYKTIYSPSKPSKNRDSMGWEAEFRGHGKSFWTEAHTAPLAICKAALLAMLEVQKIG